MVGMGSVLLSAAEETSGGLTDISGSLFLWTVVLFALFAFVLAKFGWKPLLQLIEEREKDIRQAVEGAHKANAEAQAVLVQQAELLRQAAREREEIMTRALHEADRLKTDLVTKARSASDQIITRAREQIQREKDLAILELKTKVADVAILAASKIVQASLSPEAQRKLVNDFINETLPRAR